jgi:acyl-CoA reductase-like NAD-dependent aldehyde dehydrogenase
MPRGAGRGASRGAGRVPARAADRVPARAPGQGVARPAPAESRAADRVAVRKTYKLYVGGAFPRSESGRSYLIRAADGAPIANAVRASKKDLREAVRAARRAFPGWSDATAMNRGQVLYRVAELMEGRRGQFEEEVAAAEGLSGPAAAQQVAAAIDRWVWYAGWADKIAQVLGTVNPVAASYFDFTIPEPTGVVGLVAPETSSLLGLVSRLAPILVGGNAVVALCSEGRPLPAITLGEVLATSDVPGGVVNLLTGSRRELVPVLAGHMDVNALDVWGVPPDDLTAVQESAIENVKRVAQAPRGLAERFDWLDERSAQRPEWIAAFLELKTVWHPIGM